MTSHLWNLSWAEFELLAFDGNPVGFALRSFQEHSAGAHLRMRNMRLLSEEMLLR